MLEWVEMMVGRKKNKRAWGSGEGFKRRDCLFEKSGTSLESSYHRSVEHCNVDLMIRYDPNDV